MAGGTVAAGPDLRSEPHRLGRLRARHLFFLVPLVPLAVFAAQPIRDNSFLWHIRAGAVQLDAMRVLVEDIFSLSAAGEPWRTQSWLVEIGYAQLERWWPSLEWVAWMVFALAATTVALVALTIYGRTKSVLATVPWLLVFAWLLGPFTVPRPVLFSFVLLAAVVLALSLGKATWFLVVPIIWIWAAVHGYWVLGLALIFLQAIRIRSAKLAGVGAIAAAAATLTAHGLGVWTVLLQFAGSGEALGVIREWQPPDFGSIYQGPYLLLIAGVLVAAARGRIEPRALVVIAPFLLYGLTARRAVVPAAIVIISVAALAWTPRTRGEDRASGRLLSWVAAGLVVVLILTPLVRWQPEFKSSILGAEEAYAALTAEPFFHDTAAGGYVIYRFWPERSAAIDDRAELHGDRLVAFIEAKNGTFEDLFVEYGFTQALVGVDWPLANVLANAGWTEVYRDGSHVVLTAP